MEISGVFPAIGSPKKADIYIKKNSELPDSSDILRIGTKSFIIFPLSVEKKRGG